MLELINQSDTGGGCDSAAVVDVVGFCGLFKFSFTFMTGTGRLKKRMVRRLDSLWSIIIFRKRRNDTMIAYIATANT
jgi:hypothetical protein